MNTENTQQQPYSPTDSTHAFTIIHFSSLLARQHGSVKLGITIVRNVLSLTQALQKLSIDATNNGESIKFLCAFEGEHVNLLDTQQSSRPSKTIIT